MAHPRKLQARFSALHAAALVVGGHTRRSDGWIRSQDRDGQRVCQADLEPFSAGGLGFSTESFRTKWLTFDSQNCEQMDCCFEDQAEIEITYIGLLFASRVRGKMIVRVAGAPGDPPVKPGFCQQKRFSFWTIALGLGYTSVVWKVRNTRAWN